MTVADAAFGIAVMAGTFLCLLLLMLAAAYGWPWWSYPPLALGLGVGMTVWYGGVKGDAP